VSSTGESRPGTAALRTTRLTCTLLAAGRPSSSVSFSDAAAGERNGWREVTAASECGPLRGSSVPEQSPSALLASYPEDLLSSPVDVTSASFSVKAGAACTGSLAAGGASEDQIAPRGVDSLTRGFTDFLSRPDLTLTFALVSLGAAVLFGVLHAMAPGHGKTVMAAYLVGQRGTRRQALQLGAVVTFTHTASVLALGAVLAAGALAAPELVVPVTEVLSGVLLGVVGVYLAVLALRRLRAASHDHDHDHDHDALRTRTRTRTPPAPAPYQHPARARPPAQPHSRTRTTNEPPARPRHPHAQPPSTCGRGRRRRGRRSPADAQPTAAAPTRTHRCPTARCRGRRWPAWASPVGWSRARAPCSCCSAPTRSAGRCSACCSSSPTASAWPSPSPRGCSAAARAVLDRSGWTGGPGPVEPRTPLPRRHRRRRRPVGAAWVVRGLTTGRVLA
jgi:hypothetical protein